MLRNGYHGKGRRKAGGMAGAVSYLVKGLLVITVLAFATVPQAARGEYFLSTWGSPGTGEGQFYGPQGLAVDAAGNVYVTDYFNHRIQKFDSTGRFISMWGSYGQGEGQFDGPFGVAVDAAGNVYVVEYYNDRIQKFNSNGSFLSMWGSYGSGEGEFNHPLGIALDASGNVYVADCWNHRIQKFDSNGNFLSMWGSYGSGAGQFKYPDDIAFDASGNIYVAESANNRIQKFDSAGRFITTWGGSDPGEGQFNFPTGIAVDASGNVYVADSRNHRIQKFDSNGNFISMWGSYGTEEGQFIDPTHIEVDAGIVYVSDTYNDRIQKFTVLKVTRTDLGTWAGDQHSIAWDINDLAQIAGGSGLDTVNFRNALLWNGGPEPKKNLGALEGFASSEAKDINNHGQVVGVSRDSSGLESGFLWSIADEVMQDLGALGGEGAWSSANAINNLGQVVGSSATASGTKHAFLWEAGDMQDLGALVDGDSSASDINDNGQVVGWHRVSFMYQAVLWGADGSITDLHGFLPAGSDYSEAAAINDAGQVVGDFHHPDTGFGAFLYADGSMQVLENSRNRVSVATDIDNFGQVVGFRGGMEVGDLAQAVICLWNNGVMEMQVLPPLESGRSGSAEGMNDRGQVVGISTTGSTTGDPGDFHAVLWGVTLPPPPADKHIERIETEVRYFVDVDVLSRAEGNSLITKLDAVERKIGVNIGDLMLAEKTLAEAKESNLKAACNLLQAFINEVNALIRSGRLSQFAGDYLIQQAEQAIDSIWAENALS